LVHDSKLGGVYKVMNLDVNKKRVCAITGALVILMIAFGVYYVRTHSDHPGMPEYAAVLRAAAAYSQQLTAQGLPAPQSASLEDLTRRGLVRQSEVGAFQGLGVTISLKPGAAQPQDTLMTVTFPDGRELVALGDGSIQQRAKR
jgi:hypothetical protein